MQYARHRYSCNVAAIHLVDATTIMHGTRVVTANPGKCVHYFSN